MKQPRQSNTQMRLPLNDVDLARRIRASTPTAADAGSGIQRTVLHSALFATISIGAAAPLALMVPCANAAQVSTSMGVSVSVIARAVLRTGPLWHCSNALCTCLRNCKHRCVLLWDAVI